MDGWGAYMAAPWGDFSPEGIAAKLAAKAAYDKSVKAFWADPMRVRERGTDKPPSVTTAY